MLLSISLRLDLQRSNFFEFHKKTREFLGHDEATSNSRIMKCTKHSITET
jgi:hypothetical protein